MPRTMPVITKSTYRAPWFIPNRHLQTIIPHLIRKVKAESKRERIATSDKDFLDIDIYQCSFKKSNENVIILSHGLEGNSKRPYILGMAKAFVENGWDAIAWNYRGCSGEPNTVLASYHSGKSEDLDIVIKKAFSLKYRQIALLGFSLGGNITLKYVGERGKKIDKRIKAAVAFSAPVNLESSAIELGKLQNRVYTKRFIDQLYQKMIIKKSMFPEVDLVPRETVKSFLEFDDKFTAPINGFKDALDYWHRCSSDQFLENIQIPTLLTNAANDTFLGTLCYPVEQARKNSNFWLEVPRNGGHVGFLDFHPTNYYWSERRALSFIGV